MSSAANAFVGLGEEGGDNRGQMVQAFLRAVKQPPGQPWCAAFCHTGVVVSVAEAHKGAGGTVYVCACVEENTNDDGSANGCTTLRRTRRFSGADWFIRWVALTGGVKAA